MSKILTEDGSEHENIFESDNFTSRRTTGNNLWDPESLLTGAEQEVGIGFSDRRVWPSYQHYLDACEGFLTVDEAVSIAPRRKKSAQIDTRVKLGRIN